MVSMQIQVLFQPTKTHLSQLQTWLKAEHENEGDGFFCNWNIIERSFEDDALFCITSDELAIGFLAWRNHGGRVRLDICEIQPGFRRMELGRHLIEASLARFAQKGVFIADLECQPPTSEPVWRKMGFIDFPRPLHNLYSHSGTELYRPLQAAAIANASTGCSEVLELWACEPWEVKNKSPAWTWEIKRESGSTQLVNPIIFPCSRDWQLRWRRGETVFGEKKIKHFLPGSLNADYLIYTHLDEVPPGGYSDLPK